MSRNDVSRTDEALRHFAPRHFFTNIQETKSGLERSVPNRPDIETLRSDTLLYEQEAKSVSERSVSNRADIETLRSETLL